MDRRERKYYLIKLSYIDHEFRIAEICHNVPSVKLHNADKHQIYPLYQQMISVKKEYEECLLFELRKAESRDYGGAMWIEI